MRLTRMRLGGFGSFNHGIDVDFGSDRLAVVIGRNEAGKSTLMSAVFGVLFGFKDAALQRKFEPWDRHDSYRGEVEVIADDGRRIAIRRDFRDNTAEIVELAEDGAERTVFLGRADPRGHGDEDIEYYKRLEGIVGFQDEAVFRGTVFMGQSALQMSITDQIRRLVSGSSSTDFKGVLHDLHYRFSELTMENPWRKTGKSKPREIESLTGDIASRVTKLEVARTVFMKTVALEQDVKRIEKRQEANKATLEDNKRTFTQFERFCKLLKDRDAARTRFGEANKRRETYGQLRAQIGTIDDEVKNHLRRFVRIGEDFPEVVSRLKSHQVEFESESIALRHDRTTLEQLKPIPNDKLGLLLSVFGVAAGGLVIYQGQLEFGLAVGGLLGAGLFFLGRMFGTGYQQRLAEVTAAVQAKERAVEARQSTIEGLLGGSSGVLAGEDPDTALAQYRRCRTLMEERQRKISAMTVLGEWPEIDSTYTRAAEENLKCNGLMEVILRDSPYLAEMAEDNLGVAKSMEELKRRIDGLVAEIEATAEVLTQARIELAKVSIDVDGDLPALEDEIGTRKRRLAGLELERDALRIVIDTLEECVNEFQEGDLNKLSEEVSEIFRKITNNRYTRVTLSAGMEPMLTKFDSTHITPADLSQGTQDQLYFAMRVAVARHLSRNVTLPFFLDDPFVNFDRERLAVTHELLEKLGDHQVVLVTCDRDYENWSPSLLDLDRARAEAVASGNPRLVVAPLAAG